MIRSNLRYRLLLVGWVTGLVALPAAAQQSAGTGFGQSWPTTKNLSVAPGWRVYVFVQDGVKYIQVNDLMGTVRATVATANGHFLVLPMGKDAMRVYTSDKPRTTIPDHTVPAVTIYKDSTMQMTVKSQTDGTTTFGATPLICPSCGYYWPH